MFKCCYSKKEKTNEKKEPLPESIDYNLKNNEKNNQNMIICSGCNGSFDKYNDKELIAGFCIGQKCRYYDRC